jgi:tetratricopeptide (TPR) repeat protein
MKKIARIAVLSLSMGVLALIPAEMGFAAGGGGGGSNTTPSTSPKKIKCKKSAEVAKLVEVDGKKVWKCVKRTAGLLSDEELYEQGRLLAKEGEYEWALDVFSTIKNQNDPKVLNYIGYSHRKAGRLETGFSFYKKALAINPDFVLAREYLGEGYVAAGRIDLAQLQLEEIAKRCGTTCEEYKDLAKVITTASN